MTAKELIRLADPIFEKLKAATDIREFERLLDSPQPEQWIREGKGVTGGTYKFNRVDLIEELMSEIFPHWWFEIKDQYTTASKGGSYASTSRLVVFAEYPSYLEGSAEYRLEYHGIATVVAPTLELLTMATPKTIPMAIKNACARLGDLFGKSLNRYTEDDSAEDEVVIPIRPVDAVADKEWEDLKVVLENIPTRAAALEYLNTTNFRLSIEARNIANQKPD